MGGFSMIHWIIVALVVLVLFGRGKISETMGDFGKGIKSFRKGLSEDEAASGSAPRQLDSHSPREDAEIRRQGETDSSRDVR